MKKILLSCAVLAIAFAAYFGVNAIIAKTDLSNSLLQQNVEALARGEGGNGWALMWQEDWEDCYINGQIIIRRGCAHFSAGAIYYTASAEAHLSSCGASYTVVAPGPGRKKYCPEGWSFCSSKDCH